MSTITPAPAAPPPTPPRPSTARRLRDAARTAHLGLGLTLGLVLALTGLTGATMAFEDELDRALSPGLHRATSAGPPLGPDALVAAVRAALPDREPTGLIWPAGPGQTVQVRLAGGGRAFVDPASGRVQGVRAPGHLWATIEDLHRHLAMGDNGAQLVAVGAMAGMLLALSGLVLWWPRRRRFAWQVPAGAAAAVRSREWHAVLGCYVSAGLLVVAWTGMTFTHRPVVEGLYAALTGADLAPTRPPVAAPAADGRRASLDAVVAAARAAWPDAAPRSLAIATQPGKPHRVVLRRPGWPDPNGGTFVFVDPASGTVLRALDPATAPLAWTASRLNYAVHTGAIGGWPTKLLVALVALSPAFFYVTGVLMWLPKWRARRRATRLAAAGRSA